MRKSVSAIYWDYFKQAFFHSLGGSDIIASLFCMVGYPVAKRLGMGEEAMNALWWEIPLGAFIGFLLIRIVTTPVRIQRAHEKSLEDRDEEARQLKEALAAEKDKNTPKLSAEIVLLIKGEMDVNNGQSSLPMIAAIIKVKNTGAPSIADRWRIIVTINGTDYLGVQHQLMQRMRFHGENGMVVEYSGEDSLAERTANNPIPTGGQVTGIILCFFDTLTAEQVHNNPMRVTFLDVYGCEQVATLSAGGVSGVPMGLPGANLLSVNTEHTPAMRGKYRPQIEAELLQIVSGQLFKEKQALAHITVWARVTNTGAPSVADRWLLRIECNGQTYNGEKESIDEPFVLTMADGSQFQIDAESSLVNRTTREPIPQGAVIFGVMRFTFPGFPIDKIGDVEKYILTCQDASGQTIQARNSCTDSPETLLTFPGLKTKKLDGDAESREPSP
jgi:hypothetical protein